MHRGPNPINKNMILASGFDVMFIAGDLTGMALAHRGLAVSSLGPCRVIQRLSCPCALWITDVRIQFKSICLSFNYVRRVVTILQPSQYIKMEIENGKANVYVSTPEKSTEEEVAKQDKSLGGMRTLPFIFGNEVCDIFATAGFHANMITYLTQQLNLPIVAASNILSNFGGTSSFTPLIGALIADSYIGRFWTIIIGSLIYELGLVSITLSAALPALRPPPCPNQVNCKEASSLQLWMLYLSLLLTSLGSGGIRPCVVTFAADQLDMTKSGVASRKWNLFNWHLFSTNLAVLSALTIVVYIQDNVGWGWGLGIPAISMAISIITFMSGSPLYKRLRAGGSPMVRLLQVLVAAVKKRKEVLPGDPKILYKNEELDAPISLQGKLLHSNQFKWLDKAAITTEEDANNPDAPNLWRLATIHRVEELKSLIRMLPIWAASILVITAGSHLHSFQVLQAQTMDRHFISHSFQISPASLSVFSVLTTMVGLVVYERLFVPFVRRFTGNPSGITYLQRIGIGLTINILAALVASVTETKRKSVAAKYHLLDEPKAVIPISVFWLVPQLCINGLGGVFTSVGHMEFLYDQSPESMRSTAAALFWMSTSIGNYMGTLLVTLVHKHTGQERNWLPDRNLNRGKLDYYYLLVSCIQFINILYFVTCASFYNYKPVQEETEGMRQEEDLQEAKSKVCLGMQKR